MNSESIPSQEANASFSQSEFAQALENYDYQFQKGQVVSGKVFDHLPEGAQIDIGGKSPGIVPAKEGSLRQVSDISEALPMHEEMEFLIIGEQNAEGQVTLSRRQLELQEAWEELDELQESGKSVQMQVTGSNKGGVTGEVRGLRGFVPKSHLVENGDLDLLIGQSITATFLEVDPERNKLVLSQREAARSSVMERLEAGTLAEGTVANIKPYGVFVDLNGVTGLLHIKQVSQEHVESLSELFQVGQTVKVKVIEVDEWRGRISLSSKDLESYPGEVLENLDEVMANAEARLA
ncbi:MAG: 30S ribosomal protein S1 [Cyanobacteria bacterium QS_7_48_42]|nr:MAG: 30S ribosomal protein S1 [Cyanobacteria bacterium QS_5_48_63]PSO87841.1 MAG: 30S ribosomal protein S1 [Cyanobacteria bacterium QS_3_48_167]PSO90903.1 MAG: 30S ribosomal protein S1 [Cyanobacteria bacterium QS_6_48_18]PSP01169.1 MAG: 30S ribosomal protein S1 [Cyanobacteria bacterium SW_12_48_29]PSP03200.1 MAG: 30S ribosomal protein S1 [Cyanobacteria bacterium QS_7_48_42]PSP09878.1 MAG: 30S ribosomal protein S1 [Cyanobacteria bacterium SW_10_48_33]PSP14597.1 MAG: 30S ribosomal protein S1